MKTQQPAAAFGFILILLILLPLEYFCARLAFETLGEIYEVFYYLLMILNVAPILLFIFKKRMAGFISVFIIGALIIPWQLKLGYRLLLLKEESANLVNYVYEYKQANGEFPKDASGHTFKYKKLTDYLQYKYSEQDKSFLVTYWVGTATTSHFYRPQLKRWEYYPD